MKTVYAFFLSCLLASSVQAAPKKPQKSKEELSRERASELFTQSKAYYNLHEYQKAIEGFKEAYVLAQEPVLLLNIGQCYRYMGQYQDAIVSYQTFLQEDPATPYAANVQELIQEMQKKLDELKAPEPITLPTKIETKQLPPTMLSDEPYRTPTILYGATAAAFILGAGAGGLAIALTRKEEEIQNNVGVGNPSADDLAALEENQQQQKSAKGAMVGLGVVSVVTATTGVILYRRHKKNQREPKEIVPIEAILNEPGLVSN